MNKAERILVDSIILDNSNPRIKHYLEMYTVLNEEHMLCYRLGAWSQGGPFLCARRLDGAIVPPCQRTCVVGLP